MKKDVFPSTGQARLPPLGYSARDCPVCGGETLVRYTEKSVGGWPTRTRICRDCGWRYKTVELYLLNQGTGRRPRYAARLMCPETEDPFEEEGHGELSGAGDLAGRAGTGDPRV